MPAQLKPATLQDCSEHVPAVQTKNTPMFGRLTPQELPQAPQLAGSVCRSAPPHGPASGPASGVGPWPGWPLTQVSTSSPHVPQFAGSVSRFLQNQAPERVGHSVVVPAATSAELEQAPASCVPVELPPLELLPASLVPVVDDVPPVPVVPLPLEPLALPVVEPVEDVGEDEEPEAEDDEPADEDCEHVRHSDPPEVESDP